MARFTTYNVEMTGPPTLAAKPPPAVVGPRRLTCYTAPPSSPACSLCLAQILAEVLAHLHLLRVLEKACAECILEIAGNRGAPCH